MKESLKKVKHLEDKVVGLDMQISMCVQDLQIAQQHLQKLKSSEKDLVFNVNFLKRDNVVAVANEYRKSVDQLKYIRKKISEISSKMAGIERELDQKRKQFENYSNEFELAKKWLNEENSSVVINFKKAASRR